MTERPGEPETGPALAPAADRGSLEAMDRTSSFHRLRKARQRAAHRRRGLPVSRMGRDAGPVLLGRMGDLAPDLRRVVAEFVDRALAYPWVWGCFLEATREGERLILHVPRPMTRALECLARTWLAEIEARRPAPPLTVTVCPSPPAMGSGVRTLFRR